MNKSKADDLFEYGDLSFRLKKGNDKITISIGEEKRTIKMKDLWGIAFTIANTNHKEKIMPAQKKEMMRFKKVHNILLSKDMKAGEMVTTTCIVDVPELIVQGMQNLTDADPLGALGEEALDASVQAGDT